MNRRVMGIDPGLRVTGWGLLEESTRGNVRVVASGEVRSPVKEELAARLGTLMNQLENVLAEHKPAEVAIEKIFVNKNPASTLFLGCARGVALAVAARSGARVFEYSATTVKKAVAGYGHAEKSQVLWMIQQLLRTQEPFSADTADAIALALCHVHHASFQSQF